MMRIPFILGLIAAVSACTAPTVPDQVFYRMPKVSAAVASVRSFRPIVVEPYRAVGVYNDQSFLDATRPDGGIRASHDQLWEEAPATMLQNRMISAQRTRSGVDRIAARLPANVPALRIRDQSERFERGHGLKGCFAGVALELEVDRDPHSAPRLAQRYSAEVPAETETIRPSVRAFARAIDRCHEAFWSDLEPLLGE